MDNFNFFDSFSYLYQQHQSLTEIDKAYRQAYLLCVAGQDVFDVCKLIGTSRLAREAYYSEECYPVFEFYIIRKDTYKWSTERVEQRHTIVGTWSDEKVAKDVCLFLNQTKSSHSKYFVMRKDLIPEDLNLVFDECYST